MSDHKDPQHDKKKGFKPTNEIDDTSTTGGESGTEGESGTGGKSGQIEFRDFLATHDQTRDDQLPFEEKKRLLAVHKDTHEMRVKKQKELRDQRQAVKEGKISLQTYRQERGGQEKGNHPILANKAQFSGIDRKVTALPNENIAETNEDKRNELEYQYRLRYAPENAPRFHPKPQFR